MSIHRDPFQSLLAEYETAVVQERTEWKIANDTSLGAVDRVRAYARWLAAAKRVKTLSMRLGDGRTSAPPCAP